MPTKKKSDLFEKDCRIYKNYCATLRKGKDYICNNDNGKCIKKNSNKSINIMKDYKKITITVIYTNKTEENFNISIDKDLKYIMKKIEKKEGISIKLLNFFILEINKHINIGDTMLKILPYFEKNVTLFVYKKQPNFKKNNKLDSIKISKKTKKIK